MTKITSFILAAGLLGSVYSLDSWAKKLEGDNKTKQQKVYDPIRKITSIPQK